MSPDVSAAILRGLAILRDSMPEAQLVRILESGDINQLFSAVLNDAVLERAFLPVREQIRSATMANFRYFARDLPKGGKIDGVLAVSFDVLNPTVIDAVRALDTKVVQGMSSDVRETVRAFTENGLRDGVSPRAIGRQIRDVVGLAPNQERAVANFRLLLESGDRDALARKLRDKRFDRTLGKAFGGEGDGLTAKQIDGMVDAYRRKMLAFNANTQARTAALDSTKSAQRLSWLDAADKGIVDRDRLVRTWRGVKDDRERDEHLAMEGETVPVDQPYSNGEMVPGESTYNCRCIEIFSQRTER